MNFGVRPMRLEDISQVTEIEHEAFPTTWPPTPFKKELQNRLANYLVTWAPRSHDVQGSPATQAGASEARPTPWIRRWAASVRDLFSTPPVTTPPEGDFIAGYVGTWFMADEAHIVAIAVRNAYQRSGLGELLMQASVELSMTRRMRIITLEARVSNSPAHALYEKYGFRKTGVRKGYYSDNKEDAVIMTAEDILAPAYGELFQGRVEAYRQRRGDATRILA